jgi:hypothetical protein
MEYAYGDLGELKMTGKTKEFHSELSQCHFVHNKSYVDCSGSNLAFRGDRPKINRLSHGPTYVISMTLH